MTSKKNKVIAGDCINVMSSLPDNYISSCITDPPYNYEFIGRAWNSEEIKRRLQKAKQVSSSTVVKNIPYGSGLAGGVRNERWYKKNRQNIIDYGKWIESWGEQLFRICKPGATVAVFNSTRTIAHVQVALENVGFYARDIVVYRRHSGIPKGINMKQQLKKRGIENDLNCDHLQSCLRNEWEALVIVQKPLKNNYIETFLEYETGLFFTKTNSGSFQSNIIEDIKPNKLERYNIHCTVKPIDLMRKLVKIFVPRTENSILLDPFAGSGTTLIAAKEAAINYIGIEIVPEYIDIINKRLSTVSIQENL